MRGNRIRRLAWAAVMGSRADVQGPHVRSLMPHRTLGRHCPELRTPVEELARVRTESKLRGNAPGRIALPGLRASPQLAEGDFDGDHDVLDH